MFHGSAAPTRSRLRRRQKFYKGFTLVSLAVWCRLRMTPPVLCRSSALQGLVEKYIDHDGVDARGVKRKTSGTPPATSATPVADTPRGEAGAAISDAAATQADAAAAGAPPKPSR